MTGDDLREMAELERRLAENIQNFHPHYFMDDNPAAWTACRAAELRAEALDRLAVALDAAASWDARAAG